MRGERARLGRPDPRSRRVLRRGYGQAGHPLYQRTVMQRTDGVLAFGDGTEDVVWGSDGRKRDIQNMRTYQRLVTYTCAYGCYRP